jgi:hypothetical protein
MTVAKYYDRESDRMFEVVLPEPGTVWERVPNIKDVLPKGMGMRVRDVPKRVEVQPSLQNPEGLVMFKDLKDNSTNAFHPVWFRKYYKETTGER